MVLPVRTIEPGDRVITSYSIHYTKLYEPSYETKKFAPKAPNSMQLLASRGGQDGSTLLHQDISLYAGEVEAGKTVEYNLSEGRYA